MYIFLFFLLIILHLNHKAGQNLSQWLVESVVAWTHVLNLTTQKSACMEYGVFIDDRLHFRLYFTLHWEIVALRF